MNAMNIKILSLCFNVSVKMFHVNAETFAFDTLPGTGQPMIKVPQFLTAQS
jgi:hypothetical protein